MLNVLSLCWGKYFVLQNGYFFEKWNICILLKSLVIIHLKGVYRNVQKLQAFEGNWNHPIKKYDFPSYDFRKTSSWIGLVKYLGSKEGFRAEHAMWYRFVYAKAAFSIGKLMRWDLQGSTQSRVCCKGLLLTTSWCHLEAKLLKDNVISTKCFFLSIYVLQCTKYK